MQPAGTSRGADAAARAGVGCVRQAAATVPTDAVAQRPSATGITVAPPSPGNRATLDNHGPAAACSVAIPAQTAQHVPARASGHGVVGRGTANWPSIATRDTDERAHAQCNGQDAACVAGLVGSTPRPARWDRHHQLVARLYGNGLGGHGATIAAARVKATRPSTSCTHAAQHGLPAACGGDGARESNVFVSAGLCSQRLHFSQDNNVCHLLSLRNSDSGHSPVGAGQGFRAGSTVVGYRDLCDDAARAGDGGDA